jgi:hypothetical protein
MAGSPMPLKLEVEDWPTSSNPRSPLKWAKCDSMSAPPACWLALSQSSTLWGKTVVSLGYGCHSSIRTANLSLLTLAAFALVKSYN